MTWDDIVRVPEGYSESPTSWRTLMTFEYLKELFKERHFTLDQKRYIRDRYGINADTYDLAGTGFIINHDFNIRDFYLEFGPTKGIDEKVQINPSKKLKVDKLKKLVCECCNGQLDPSSIKNNIIKCEFCGTKYIVE